MKNITIPLAILIIVMSSCTKSISKKPDPNISEFDIFFSKAAMEYVQLPVNRHFIYKDSATGNIDSVVVTQSDLSNFIIPGDRAFSVLPVYSQIYHLMLTKTNDSATTWFDGLAKSLDGADYRYATDTMASLRFAASDNIITDTVPDYGFSSNVVFDNYDYISSMTVESKTYHDVIVDNYSIYGIGPGRPGYINSLYYWARNVGIIKRTVKTNSFTITSLLESYGN
jgi:hypothetical protein